jgi:hypothetical protein
MGLVPEQKSINARADAVSRTAPEIACCEIEIRFPKDLTPVTGQGYCLHGKITLLGIPMEKLF